MPMLNPRTIRIGLALAVLAVASFADAQPSPSQVDQDEVRRMGNMVQRAGIGPRAAATDAVMAALAPPASDADKWFVSLVCSKNCGGCVQLKKKWLTDPWLRAIAKPDDPANSWAHYNVYQYEDRSQQFRWEKITLSEFPAVLIQPPKSGKYGDAGTVIFQGTYEGDPKALADSMLTAVKRYIESRTQAGPSRPASPSADQPAPWTPTPKEDESVPLHPFAPQVDVPVLPADQPVRIPPVTIPAPGPSPAPAPEPQDEDLPDSGEIIVVTDSAQDLDDETRGRVENVVGELRKRHRHSRERRVDWSDAKDRYPLHRDELPAVIATKGGKIRDKITAQLLPYVAEHYALPWLRKAAPFLLLGFLAVVTVAVAGFAILRRLLRVHALPVPPVAPSAPLANGPPPAP